MSGQLLHWRAREDTTEGRGKDERAESRGLWSRLIDRTPSEDEARWLTVTVDKAVKQIETRWSGTRTGPSLPGRSAGQ